jgi:hypothetical protein
MSRVWVRSHYSTLLYSFNSLLLHVHFLERQILKHLWNAFCHAFYRVMLFSDSEFLFLWKLQVFHILTLLSEIDATVIHQICPSRGIYEELRLMSLTTSRKRFPCTQIICYDETRRFQTLVYTGDVRISLSEKFFPWMIVNNLDSLLFLNQNTWTSKTSMGSQIPVPGLRSATIVSKRAEWG